MIKVAIIGYGNIGSYAIDAIESADDMELVGVVRRKASLGKSDHKLSKYKIVSNIEEFGKVDVALLCTPTRSIPTIAVETARLGINTVDSFDIHGEALVSLYEHLSKANYEGGSVSIISAGWDPGSDSVVRALMEAIVPKGVTYTNFGPGMSMGHSVAAKSIEGVKDALSVTIPVGTGMHRRMVYVEIEEGMDFDKVEQAIKSDDYFSKDDTRVTKVEDIKGLIDMGHGVVMERKGVSGLTHNQLLEFRMKINNPALTAQIMVACARATMKQKVGCYTMLEIPIIDLLKGEKKDIIKRLV